MLKEDSLFLTNQSLNYVESPKNGPPLILLHGVLRQWGDYLPVMPFFTMRWTVYGIDFRGHGKSSRTPGHYLVADYMRDAATFLSYQLREPAVIYGHSLGAMVALRLAAEMREHVRAIVLEDPPFQTMGSRIRETQYHSQFVGVRSLMKERMEVSLTARNLAMLPITMPGTEKPIALGELRDPASLRWLAACLQRVDPEVLSPITEGQWLEGYDVDQTIQRIRCPTLVLQADAAAGGMLTNDDADFMGRSIPEFARLRFPGVGHSIRMSSLNSWLPPVTSFLESVRQ